MQCFGNLHGFGVCRTLNVPLPFVYTLPVAIPHWSALAARRFLNSVSLAASVVHTRLPADSGLFSYPAVLITQVIETRKTNA